MKRHNFALLVAVLGLCFAMPNIALGASRPNVIVIMVDDMGYSDPGCFGGEVRTPNLDRLASNGVRFSQFYNCARCCPTRASLLTGAYSHRVGLANNGRTMSVAAPTLAERLKGAGYNTAMAGKWHLSALAQTRDEKKRIAWMNHEVELGIPFADPKSYPIRRGFDRYYGVIWGVIDYFDPFSLVEGDKPVASVPDDYYITDAITDYSVATIKQFSKTDKPFFLYVAHTAPHWPIHARPEDIAKYKGVYDKGWDELRKQRFRRQVEMGLFDKDMPLGDVITGGKGWANRSKKEQAYLAAKLEVHAAMVDRVDQGIGRIVDVLNETKQLDNTVIFFLSDNGASPETPGGPGYDRNGKTRDGKVALRDRQLQQGDNITKLGSEESYTGIGRAWSNAVNTPLRYWKKESYEGGCRTPFVVHWPNGLKVKPGSINRNVGHVIDIAPTCLEIAGVEPKGAFKMDGKSLVPLLQGKTRDGEAGHEALFFEHAGGKGARIGDWKIAALGRKQWELFNLASDPGETKDLSKQQPERLAAMINKWNQWADRVGVPGRRSNSPRKPKSATGVNAIKSPMVANRRLTITCEVNAKSSTGVILAQGGREQGYAIHLSAGRLMFDVRVNGKVKRIQSKEQVKSPFSVEAELTKTAMRLSVNGKVVAESSSPGLIPVQPKDGLSVGHDDLSEAGDYSPPNRLNGKVTKVNISTK